MSILRILNELASDNSRLAKEAILKREQNNKLLQRVIKAAFDPFINYYVLNAEPVSSASSDLSLDDMFDILRRLSTREITGNKARALICNTKTQLSDSDGEVFYRILQHDLRCGIATATINKIWPGTIPVFDVCLAHKDTSGIKYPAYAQIKYDGGRCHLHFDGVKATAWSRNGKQIELHGALDNDAKTIMSTGDTWDGEIVFRKSNGSLHDRKTSNGLFNKGVKNSISESEAAFATFFVWDNVDFTETIPYDKRLESMGDVSTTTIRIAGTIIVKNEQEGLDFYAKCLSEGEEGAILKNKTFKWQPKRIKDIGKMKAEEEADVLVTGWFAGKPGTKYEDGLGGLEYTTSDKVIEGNVGSGFSDDIRFAGDYDSWVGKIITIRYNQRIKSSTDKKESLFLARYIETRLDKDIANSSDELK